MKRTALVLVACLLGASLGYEPDTLWVSRLDLGADELSTGIDSRGDAIAVAGCSWSSPTYDWLVARLDQNGDTVWTRTISDTTLYEIAYDACIDAESNLLVAGSVQSAGSLYCRGVPGFTDNRWIRNPLDTDQLLLALTAKYDSLGELKWLRTDTNCLGFGIACDSAGNSYVSGTYFTGANLDLWLAKLSPSGDLIWTRTLNFDVIDIGYRLALDASGNVAVAGRAGSYQTENFDCVTVKLTPDGDTIWTRRYDRGIDDAARGLAADPGCNIIVAGWTVKDIEGDALLVKYDSSGTVVWDRAFDFDADDAVTGAACDSAGNIYAAGYTGTSGTHDCLVMKLDSASNVLWTTTYGGSADDGASDAACDAAGNPVVAGWATDSTAYDTDLLTVKYSPFTGLTGPTGAGPAPARTHRTITAAPEFVLSVPCPGSYDIRLCDLCGRTREQVFDGPLSKGAHRFSLAGQPAGLYILRVAAPEGEVSSQTLVLVK